MVTRSGVEIAALPAPDVQAGNVAVAVALALSVGLPEAIIAAALADLPSVPNRGAVTHLSNGATAVDDTFNSNPEGSRAALATMVRLATEDGKRVVVTPGMVELGARQAEENATFAAAAARLATHVVVVGFTNRRPLLEGAGQVPPDTRADVVGVDTHADAVAWVRANTGPGDVVLYENQLPDHYP